MRPRDSMRYQELVEGLESFAKYCQALPGVNDPAARQSFVEQLLESVRRVNYVKVVRYRRISPKRMDPHGELFDPLLAAIRHARTGNHDEAAWLVFLFVHFGKHPVGGWRYLKEVYGRRGCLPFWTWCQVNADTSLFRQWLHRHSEKIRYEGGPGGFGNHRKYQSLSAQKPSGTGAAFETYVDWVSPPRTHQGLFTEHLSRAAGDPGIAFDLLYRSMSSVASFGRTARFDYLAMIGKLGLADIQPGKTYIQHSTGPKAGAKLLLYGNSNARAASDTLETSLRKLGDHLGIGMQEMEDALCNWQKSPSIFRPFRG